MPLTEQWLIANGLSYDELVRGQEGFKSKHRVDALIDDYPRNLAEFLTQTTGVGVLVDQPWNQDIKDLEPWLDGPRLVRVAKLLEIPAWLERTLPQSP